MKAEDADIHRTLQSGRTLLGPGWTCVSSFDDDDDDYEEETEEYVVMDLGTAMDARTLQTEATYQLIGMDTPMPFLKIGEHVFQGTVAPLIGDEVLFDVVRQEDDPQRPHHRPAYKTRHRVELRAVKLSPRGTHPVALPTPLAPGKVDELPRGMFPSRPWKLPKPEDDVAGPSTPTRPPALAVSTPAPIAASSDDDVGVGSGTDRTPTRGRGRGRGRARGAGRGRTRGGGVRRTAITVSTLEDLADINHAGGLLGDVRLEISNGATPELVAAVNAVRNGRTSGRLTRAQEERLVRGLPATGPGSRGGRGARAAGTGLAMSRRGRTTRATGLAAGFVGVDVGEEGEAAGEGSGGADEGGEATGEDNGGNTVAGEEGHENDQTAQDDKADDDKSGKDEQPKDADNGSDEELRDVNE